MLAAPLMSALISRPLHARYSPRLTRLPLEGRFVNDGVAWIVFLDAMLLN